MVELTLQSGFTARKNRHLRTLLLQEASRLSGFTLRQTRHP